MAGVTSAMNSLDHMDGNCAGAAAVSAFFCFAYAWDRLNPQPWLSYASVAVLGGCLGFLQFNFKPARIFLGNSGAFLLGFLLAAMSILGGWGSREEPIKAVLVPPLLLGVPLYDITLATLLRWKERTGKPVFVLLYSGLRERDSRPLRKAVRRCLKNGFFPYLALPSLMSLGRVAPGSP